MYRCPACKKSRVPCSLLISLTVPLSHLLLKPVQTTSRHHHLQSFPRAPAAALSQPPMQALPLYLIDPRTSSQPRPSHQLKLRPRRQPLSKKRRHRHRSRNHQQPNHRLPSRPSLPFESLVILRLPKLSRRLTLLLPRREAKRSDST